MFGVQTILPHVFFILRIALWGIFTSLVTFMLLMMRRFRSRNAVREPPCPPADVPIPQVGHLLGLLRRRMQYWNDIGLAWREPMAKISLLGTNVYIIGSVKMIPMLQRQPKVISSRAWFAKFVCSLIGCSPRSLKIFQANLGATSNGDSLLLEGVRTTRRILNSETGTGLNHDAARIVSEHFKIMTTPDLDVPLDLFEWIKHEMLHLVSESAYGPDNPFWDPEVERAFWEFEGDTLALCMSRFVPKFFLSRILKGIKGRETLVKALDDYLKSGSLKNGSPIVNAHYLMLKASVDDADIARFECANALGSFANTIPTSFWTIFHVFSDPKLLADIRSQLLAITTTKTSENGVKIVNSIDLQQLKLATVLFSAVEEVSRFRATGVGVRVVTEDTTVGEGEYRYHLKKGGWILIANRALHTDKTVWGEDADQFVASRFRSTTPHLSFRGFGNGASTCCGKNFALYHIATFMAIMVMRYDILPATGEWKEPGQDGRDTASQVAGPLENPMVSMCLREDPENVSWEFQY